MSRFERGDDDVVVIRGATEQSEADVEVELR